MSKNWVSLVSVAALALAGTLAVACGGDDDDDDNNNTGGKGGSGGSAGAGGGSGSGGGSGTGGGSGSGGSSGAGGGTVALPPTDVAALKTALDAGNYLPEIKAAKWVCQEDEDNGVNFGETEVAFHIGDLGTATAKTRVCANFSLADQEIDTTKNAAGFPLGAASVKETYDGDDIVAIAYYALTGDGETWFTAYATPATPQPPGTNGDYDVVTGADGGGCGGAACHTGDDFVREGNLLARSAMLAPPNPYEQLATPPPRR